MDIQFCNVSLHMDGVAILSDISCMVPSGAFVAIIGENGAGKSSLLHCIHTHLHHMSGDILLAGVSLRTLPRKTIAQYISAVLQDAPADLGMSVADIVMMGRYPHLSPLQSPNHIDRTVVETALKKVDLLPLMPVPFATLSGGQKQRVQIARALTQTPQVLLLDEPTNHLDIKQQIAILKVLKSMGITVLACLHDLNVTASYADYIICLKNGRIVGEGTPTQVLTPDTIYTLFGVHTAVTPPAHGTPPHIRIKYTA